MLGFIVKRLLFLVPVLLAATFFAFSLSLLSGTDPAVAAIRVNAMVPTPELVAQVRHEFGLDKPFLVQYVHWLGGALSGDFGRSWSTGRPVAALAMEALPNTLVLAIAALAVTLCASVVLGAASAFTAGKATDKWIRTLVFGLSSVPNYWIGLLLMWLFAVKLGWLPTSGMRRASAVILPAATLSLEYIGTYVRLLRSEIIAARGADWVLFAKSRGLGPAAVAGHLFINSLRGSLTALGMSIPKLAAGAFIVECIFAWPGLGRLCVDAVFTRDIPVIQAYVVITSALFVLFNLAVDVFLVWLDPREAKLDQTRGFP